MLLTAATGIGQLLKRQADTGLNPAVVETVQPPHPGLVDALRGAGRGVSARPNARRWCCSACFPSGPCVNSSRSRRRGWPITARCSGSSSCSRRCNTCWSAWNDIRVVQRADPGLCVPVYSCPDRDGGRLQTLPGTLAKIQSGLMICVYCLSHAPALLYLEINPPPTRQGCG